MSPPATSKEKSRVRRLGAGLALVATLLAAAPAEADEYCQDRAIPTASVLIIHGGGWMGGSAADGRDLCSALAPMGYRARSLEYPLWTVPGSIEYAHRAAREEAARGRPVYAVGISAGGSIAEYLAVRSYIDGAVAIAPLSDFVNWRPPAPGFWGRLGMTPAMRLRLSPYHNVEDPAPMRLIHSPQDHMVPYEQSLRMLNRCGAPCELIPLRLGLGHLSLGSRGPVLEWFRRRAASPGFAASRHARMPVILRAAIHPRSSAVPRARGPSRGHRGTLRPTSFGVTLSETSRLTFTIERRGAAGRRRSCPKEHASARPALRCSPYQRVGRAAIDADAGVSRIPLAAIIRGRALPPGRYRATLTASGSSGRRSESRHLRFRVVGSDSRPARRARGSHPTTIPREHGRSRRPAGIQRLSDSRE